MNTHQTSATAPAGNRDKLCTFISETLNSASIADYSCNGLQVEGAPIVNKIGLAVDACMESFTAAVQNNCQMLIVHHGIIWGGLTAIAGCTATQLRYLFQHNCSLYAAHLPLDLHPQYGNNAVLAQTLGLTGTAPFGLYKGISIGYKGTLPSPLSPHALADILNRTLATTCTVLPFGPSTINSVGIVSGGAADSLDEAIDLHLDCFITGEPSHQNFHAAKEAGITVMYAGHYHTEKGGVTALGHLIEKTFGIDTVFLDIPTPV